MKLIVGLGNPGREYENTRHNVGFMAIDRIAHEFNVSINKSSMKGLYGELIYKGEKYMLLKPQKYMNLSGEVIRDYLSYYKIDVSDLLVIYDDLDTPVGSMRLRLKGSSGGHNGIKDIEKNIHTSEFKRIKFGISNDKTRDTKDYVLGTFSTNDKKLLDEALDKVVPIFKDYSELTFENLMNKYNGK